MFMFESNLQRGIDQFRTSYAPPMPSIRQDATAFQCPLRPMEVKAMLHNTTSLEASVARLAPSYLEWFNVNPGLINHSRSIVCQFTGGTPQIVMIYNDMILKWYPPD